MPKKTNQDRQRLQPVKLVIELVDSPVSAYGHLERGTKYRYLVDANRRKRGEIIDWLRMNDLADAVVGIGDATAFNLLYLEAARNIKAQLRLAPYVARVSEVENISVRLLAIDPHAVSED